MSLLLNKVKVFKELSQNPTKSGEDSLIVYRRKLKRDGIIDDETLRKILPTASTHGVLYGLPRVHEPGGPFRLLSPLLTLTTITLRPISFGYFNLSQLTSLLVWTSSALQNGPRHTIIMANTCAHFMLVYSSPTFHLMKQDNSVSTNCML